MKDYGQKEFIRVANQIIACCKMHNIQCYIYHKALTSDSVYLRFDNPQLRSVRISDHCGINKYKYKFNVRFDIQESYKESDWGIERYYFTADNRGIQELIIAIKLRNDIVTAPDYIPTYEVYKTPAHKNHERT